MAKAGRGSEQFVLRLPDGMRDRVKQLADEHGRSMNSEIVSALEEWLQRADYDREREEYEKANPLEGPKPGDVIEEGAAPMEEIQDFFVNSPDDVERIIQRMVTETEKNLRKSMMEMLRGRSRKS